MKKQVKIYPFILYFLILILLPFYSYAQERTFGLKGGLNLASLSIEDVSDANILPGFHGGAWVNIPLSGDISLQPELLYSGKGVEAVYDEEFLGIEIAEGETKIRLNYIDIPVYVNYNLSEDFHFFIGPYVGFLLNANINTSAEILDFLDYTNQDKISKDEFKSTDFGLSGGLGFSIDPVSFGFNYSLGLMTVATDESQMEALLESSKNNVIQVFVGIHF
ncbi:MAG: porin family protein [Bacteroidales bacterium]